MNTFDDVISLNNFSLLQEHVVRSLYELDYLKQWLNTLDYEIASTRLNSFPSFCSSFVPCSSFASFSCTVSPFSSSSPSSSPLSSIAPIPSFSSTVPISSLSPISSASLQPTLEYEAVSMHSHSEPSFCSSAVEQKKETEKSVHKKIKQLKEVKEIKEINSTKKRRRINSLRAKTRHALKRRLQILNEKTGDYAVVVFLRATANKQGEEDEDENEKMRAEYFNPFPHSEPLFQRLREKHAAFISATPFFSSSSSSCCM